MPARPEIDAMATLLNQAVFPAAFIGLALVSAALPSCRSAPQPEKVRSGADLALEEPYIHWLKRRRLGVITNHTGLDTNLTLTIDRLEQHPDIRLTAIFAPEHGISGALEAGEEFESGTRVFSLYGRNRAPTAEMLQHVDLLVYDIQDIGVRFYTYISTLAESMKAAASQRIPFVVLDRPAPLNGEAVEGPLLDPGLESFLGIHPIPVRYGMTPGEIARMLNDELSLGCDLKVIPMQGWQRSMWQDETGLPWVATSPNMPHPVTAQVYPGFCLIEGTNLSEGRGTTQPFQLFGAPWLDSRRLALRLNSLGLEGVRFRPQDFRPTFSKHKGELCRGIQVHVLDRRSFQSLEAALHVLTEVRRLHPDRLTFRGEHFDRLIGNRRVRKELEQGVAVAEITASWPDRIEEFRRRRQPYLLY